jgi:hypothetical protein
MRQIIYEGLGEEVNRLTKMTAVARGNVMTVRANAASAILSHLRRTSTLPPPSANRVTGYRIA